jgi:hypothetical protein
MVTVSYFHRRSGDMGSLAGVPARASFVRPSVAASLCPRPHSSEECFRCDTMPVRAVEVPLAGNPVRGLVTEPSMRASCARDTTRVRGEQTLRSTGRGMAGDVVMGTLKSPPGHGVPSTKETRGRGRALRERVPHAGWDERCPEPLTRQHPVREGGSVRIPVPARWSWSRVAGEGG